MNKNEMINTIVMALCELAVGVLLLINPIGFTVWIFIVLGIVLLAMGLWEVISYFRTEPASAFLRQSLAIGLAEIAAGCFCILQYDWFVVTFPLLTILYGVMILLTGFVKVQWTVDMFRLRKRNWYLAGIGACCPLCLQG